MSIDVKYEYERYKMLGKEIAELEEQIDQRKLVRSSIANLIHKELQSQAFEVNGEHFKVIKKSDGSAFIRSATPAKPKDAAE